MIATWINSHYIIAGVRLNNFSITYDSNLNNSHYIIARVCLNAGRSNLHNSMRKNSYFWQEQLSIIAEFHRSKCWNLCLLELKLSQLLSTSFWVIASADYSITEGYTILVLCHNQNNAVMSTRFTILTISLDKVSQ